MEASNTFLLNLMVLGQLVLRYSCQYTDPTVGDNPINIYARCIGIANPEMVATLIESSRLKCRGPQSFQLYSSLHHLVLLVLFRQSTRNGSVRASSASAILLRLRDCLVDLCDRKTSSAHCVTNQPGWENKTKHYNSPAYSSSPASPTQNFIFSR